MATLQSVRPDPRHPLLTVEVEKSMIWDWYGLAKPVVLGRFNDKMGVTSMVYQNCSMLFEIEMDTNEGEIGAQCQHGRGSGPGSHLPHAMTTIS